MNGKMARQNALSRLPELIRHHVENEVWRIYKKRNAR